jgi:LPXTG-motif cell wall-anchored protein
MFSKLSSKLLLIALFGVFISSLWIASPTALAQSQVALYPGQTGVFTLKYINAGDSDAIASAITSISLNDKLTYVPGFLSESFGGGPAYCIADAIGGGIVSVSSGTTSISYRPRSATTTTGPCNGAGTAGASTLTAAPEATPGDQTTWPAGKTGVITFRAILKDNAGLNVGDIVNFAIIGETTLDGGSGGAASLRISVLAVPNNTTPLVTADIPGLTVSCNPAQVNSTTTCTFTLPSDKTLPPNMTFSIGNATTQSNNCTAVGSAVTCTGVPTGSVSGLQTIFGKIGSDPRTDTGEKANILAAGVLPRTGGETYIIIGLVSVSGLAAGFIFSAAKKRKIKVNQ